MGRGGDQRIGTGWGRDLLFATGAGLFLGVVGPFGSYFNGPVWQRCIVQVVYFWVGVLLIGSAIRFLMRLNLSDLAMWPALAALVAALMVPFAAAVALGSRIMWPAMPHLPPFDWYWESLVVAEPAAFLLTLMGRYRNRALGLQRGAEAPAAPTTAPGLLGAGPAEVLCLQMEDHYVRVHTASGSRLVLAPLRQAMAELKGAQGLQVHRSWWVASRAVDGAEREGRNLRLRLVNGVMAPVARSALPSVRAAGWITED